MPPLPVSEVLDKLLTALETRSGALLVAPPGAGKSTWLPLQLLSRVPDNGKILLLEPRRLAARNVARRLAENLGESTGQTIGYRMRGESSCGPDTRLEVVTEGILTRMLQQDPELNGVSLVILDEFHERSLQADTALALLLDVQQGLRDDLKLLLMSATPDYQRLSVLLPEVPVIISQGRSFPVERHFIPLSTRLPFAAAVAREATCLLNEHQGSMLIFLPGEREIMAVKQELLSRLHDATDIFPLYGAMSLTAQQQAIAPSPEGRRKVVLATNIAETSLTIDGIRLVVDSGLERAVRYDTKSGVSVLQTQRISQASMVQRAGRAGRLTAGFCWHLLSQEQAERAAAVSEPEIINSELSAVMLDILAWGCREMSQLQWLDLPPQKRQQAALQLLQQLGATDAGHQLTATGRKMAALGTEPRLAAILCAAGENPAAMATASLLVAILEDPPRNGTNDLLSLFLHPQPGWLKRAKALQQRTGVRGSQADDRLLAVLLMAGFSDQLARQRGGGGRYLLAKGVGAGTAADDPLSRYEWLLVLRLSFSSQQPEARIRLALPVDIAELARQCPDKVEERDDVEWDEEKGILRVRRQQVIGSLILTSRPGERPAAAQLHQAMLRWVRAKGLSVLPWTPAAEQIRARLACAGEWLNDADWPPVTDDALLDSLEQWLLPEMATVTDARSFNTINISTALLHLITWSQRQRLDSALPTHYTVPTGSRVLIRYNTEQPPVLAVRMQEMFGEADTPVIAGGRIPLVLELLSPAMRPLQITRDLAGFWQGAYREVQKEMKGRYPKHPWPDSPATAMPTRRSKKFSPGHL
ncbi:MULTISPECIES: ATP-dependent helicase HrpB [Tatumella]|uniref:ATP-dependent helicase HrpB n=1 Tax=Tatumella punctata TaxID=399969 RepID=A0ABW1VRE3_9GAMM|nr:ATP-dependent helicase HrpB [Tatumella sp. JGM130]MBS0894172.1 ATP-dependent helicase HrpB [Tatumella sp. JGM130]